MKPKNIILNEEMNSEEIELIFNLTTSLNDIFAYHVRKKRINLYLLENVCNLLDAHSRIFTEIKTQIKEREKKKSCR